MALLNFRKKETPAPQAPVAEVEAVLKDYSIEVMPRTAEKVEDFRALLPEGTLGQLVETLEKFICFLDSVHAVTEKQSKTLGQLLSTLKLHLRPMGS